MNAIANVLMVTCPPGRPSIITRVLVVVVLGKRAGRGAFT